MQEIGQLVLGIDLCDDITQVTVMRPHAAEPDAVYFDAADRKEYLPTSLSLLPEVGMQAGEKDGETVLTGFFHKAICGHPVEWNGVEYSPQDILELYLGGLFRRIKERYPEQDMGIVALTCEEVNTDEQAKRILLNVMRRLESFCKTYLVMSHLEAFMHFVIRQEEELWQNGSAAFDYASEGLLFYHMRCRTVGGRRFLLAEYKDYSETIPAGFTKSEETHLVALTFERLAAAALGQRTGSLFVTGRSFEGEWVADVLRLLSGGRRVFRGENLYTQGACYAATEAFRGEGHVEFSLLMPEQILYDVYLMAETTAQEEEIQLAKVGQSYQLAKNEIEVLLDTTDKLSFKVVPAGGGSSFMLRIAPRDLELRPDKTNRYQVRMFFVSRDCMAIQVKDVGFGEFYPSTHRIYEELVDLSQLEM